MPALGSAAQHCAATEAMSSPLERKRVCALRRTTGMDWSPLQLLKQTLCHMMNVPDTRMLAGVARPCVCCYHTKYATCCGASSLPPASAHEHFSACAGLDTAVTVTQARILIFWLDVEVHSTTYLSTHPAAKLFPTVHLPFSLHDDPLLCTG